MHFGSHSHLRVLLSCVVFGVISVSGRHERQPVKRKVVEVNPIANLGVEPGAIFESPQRVVGHITPAAGGQNTSPGSPVARQRRMEWLPRWESLLFYARIDGWLTLRTARKDGRTIISPAGARALILEVVMDTDISEAADRREWLMTAPVICMECGSNNIELTDPGKQPAKWKCRKCAVRFDWEPSTRSLNCLSCYPKMCRCP